jgi:fluoride exporter
MRHFLLVGLGGCLGAMARYATGVFLFPPVEGRRFPLTTFVVNVSGCLAAGLLAGLAERRVPLTPEWRLFLFTGILGGFTTFSAFGLETMQLLQRRDFPLAAGYAGGSVLMGLLALWLGLRAAA